MSDIKSLFETKLKSKMQNVPGLSLIFANVNNLVWQEAPPPDASDAQNALAYVTNADDNGDGKIDTIYFNMGNIRRALQQNGMNPSNPTDQDMDYLLGVVGEILAHEYGHIQDYKPGQENPFPGGEQAADQYAHTVMEQMKNVAGLQKEFIKLANRYDQGNESKQADALDEAVKYLNNNNSTKDLVRLANNLDRLSLTKEADLIDNILKKAFFGLSPMAFFVGCQGKGGLKHKHFAWAATSDGNFISTWEDADQKTYEMTADNGKKFFVVEIHNLDSMSEDSYFQNIKNVYSYDQIQDGTVYDDLENFENGDYSFLKEEDKYDGTPSPFTLYFELVEGGLTGGKMQTFPKTSPQ